MKTYLVIKPAFPQRNLRVGRNVLKYSASSGKFPVTQRYIIHHQMHADQVTGANRVPLEKPYSAGERGGELGICRICGLFRLFRLFSIVDAGLFKKNCSFCQNISNLTPLAIFLHCPLSTVNNLRLRYLRNAKNRLLYFASLYMYNEYSILIEVM